MSYYALAALINGLTSTFLGLFVLSQNPKSVKHLTYFFFAAAVSFWSYSYFFWQLSESRYPALLYCRLLMAGAIFIPVFYLHHIFSLLRIKHARLPVLFPCYLFCFASAIADMTPYFVSDVSPILQFKFWPKPGPLFHLFLVLWLGIVVYTEWVIFSNLVRAKGILKTQLQYILIGTTVGYAGGSTNYFLWYDIPILPFGNIFASFYVLVTSYAIIRHKLMDIEVIIRKTLVFTGIVAAAVSVIAFPLALIQAVIGKTFGVPDPFILMALGIATTVLIYHPVERVLLNVTDKYLFQKKINYRLLLREASEYLAHVDSLKQQARNIVAFLLKKARIASASVYAFAAPDRSALVLKASRPLIPDENLKRISLSHPIFEYFSKYQGPLEINALKESREGNAKEALEAQELDGILTLMRSLQAEAAIPCFGGEAASKFDRKSSRLKGVLFLGHQKSDEPYSEEDLDVFFTLGQESSIAFENARLYDEAINRAAELVKANEELNGTNKRLKETHAAFLEEKKRAVLAGIGKSVAHEIRNPITPINSHLYFGRKRIEEMKRLYESSLSHAAGGADHQKFLKNFASAAEQLSGIEKCKDRIQGIVNTLYNLVAQRTGSKVEVKVDMVVDSAIEEVKYQNYWETLNQPNIENRVPRDLPFALGIPQDIQGVFVNLIVNALHAMENKADKSITINAMIDDRNNDMIKIEFSDNGCGVPGELQEKIFEHGFTTKGAKGTGLGLFYCKNIIEQVHGGTISVKSKAGVGTDFTICLPRYKKAG